MKFLIKTLILIFFPAALMAAGNGFVIKGNVSGIKSGTVAITRVYHLQNTQTVKENLPEKLRIVNGQFEFSGKLSHPVLVVLKISTRNITVFLENTSYTISGSLNSLTGESLIGGTANAEWQQHTKDGNSIDVFIQEHPNSVVSAYLALMQANTSFNIAQKSYKALQAKAQNSWYGKQLKLIIEKYKKAGVGAVFPALKLHNPDGTDFSIKDLKGKIVVLDFWASWCAPCRAYIPTLKKQYTKYKDRGVTFVSVSVDEDINKWKKAMQAEQMEWKQVLAQGAFDEGKGVKKLLNIYFIPYVIIVGKDGKIEASLDFKKKNQMEAILDKAIVQ